MQEEIKKIIREAKNICLIPSEYEPESLTSSLALFYTLRELGKNVNFAVGKFPENLQFLVPDIDFIASPKNFVISIPRSVADVSQIYYEKTEENLKIHLTTDKGQLKKENIAFYFEDAKPDLVITLGVRDFKKHLDNNLDSFGFILGSPIINIDNTPENLLFGQYNIIEKKSLTEIIIDIVSHISQNPISKQSADCLLTGLILHYENFRKPSINESVFLLAGELIKKGADNQKITENLYKATEKELQILGELFKNMHSENGILFSQLKTAESQDLSGIEIKSLVNKVKGLGIQSNMLVVWESHNSDPVTKGFFYSDKSVIVAKIAEHIGAINNGSWAFINTKESILTIKERVEKLT